MQLHEQRPARFRDLCNWPPMWVRLGKLPSTSGKAFVGEVGILKEARYHRERGGRIYLTMVHDHATYVACLVFENRILCQKAFERLRCCYGMAISEIGSSELPE